MSENNQKKTDNGQPEEEQAEDYQEKENEADMVEEKNDASMTEEKNKEQKMEDLKSQKSDKLNEAQPTEEVAESSKGEADQLSEEPNGEDHNDQEIEEKDKDEIEEEISEEKSEEQQLREFHKNQVEAALYASGRALSIEEISLKLDIGKKEVEELINELAFDYLERSTALIIAQTGDKYQMQIKHEYTDSISDFAEGGAIKEKYLRTLTVIALKQPILKKLLVKLRGTGAYQHVKYLVKQGLVDSVKKGRTSELTTTDKYAEMFGLPKNKSRMKETLIAQLGVEEDS
ncbi:MAG: SMC-Scp complex subunit ScpB [Promethearchaeia archaeon]